MTELFLDIVNMSISAGWLVLAVLALRLILKKAPKWVNVLLWGIVAIRLICPFSIESALSLIPSKETISPEIMMDWTPEISTGVEALDQVVNPVISTSFAPKPWASANPLQILIPVWANIWLLGVLILLTYTAISYMTLRRKLRTAVILRDNTFQCETVSSPFVLGILKPKIYLPYSMDGNNLNHVVAHEQAHIKRKDHWWKPLGFLLLTIYWFNPLMWLAYIMLCRDIELACDEKVIAELGNEQRADYTQALVACAVNRRMIAACPLAFGEVGVKDRVKSIMNYRKPTFWIIVTALMVCVVVAVCFLTDPNPSREFSMSSQNVSDIDVDTIMKRIQKVEDLGDVGIYMNSNNFTLTVDGHFNWVDSQAIRYFFWDHQEIRSAQLRFFPDEDKVFFTESSEWVDQKYRYLLQHYLEALKNLPQDEIRQMAPADQYLIEFVDRGRPSDYDRLITYSSEGVCQIDGWFIHLRILPLHNDGEGYSGTGDEVVDLFYGQEDKSSAGYIKLDDSMKYYLTVPIDNVYRIEVITENSSGDCVNADESCFKKGERVYLEQLDGMVDLRGVGVVAYDRQGVILNVVSIPESEYSQPVNAIAAHGWFLAPDGADIGMLNTSEPSSSESTEMIPTDTELQGLHAGSLLLPIDGNIYRYDLTDHGPEGVMVDKLIFSFTEPDIYNTISWEVYSLKEYPDLSGVLIISDTHGAWLCTYSPPKRCSDTALDDATQAGYVVMEDGIATHGQDIWKEFYESVQQGKAASVTVAHYFTLDPERFDSEYYEVYSQDYPCLYECHLEYDGKRFTLTEPNGNDARIRTFEYLMKYDNTEFYSKSSLTPGRRYDYVLTQDNRVTWEQIWKGLVSSYTGADIDHYSIYSERIQ